MFRDGFLPDRWQELTAAEVAPGVKHHVAPSRSSEPSAAGQRLFPRQTCQEKLIKSSQFHTRSSAPPNSSVPAWHRAIAIERETVRLSHLLIQPMAEQDVATRSPKVALATPVNGHGRDCRPRTRFHTMRSSAGFSHMTEPAEGRSGSGGALFRSQTDDQFLVPGSSPHIGSTKFDWWLTHVRPRPRDHRNR